MECSCCWVYPDYPWFGLIYLPYAIPLFHESFPFNHEYTLVSFCSENGFEEGLSTLGLVSGLFGARWSVGWVALEFTSRLSVGDHYSHFTDGEIQTLRGQMSCRKVHNSLRAIAAVLTHAIWLQDKWLYQQFSHILCLI